MTSRESPAHIDTPLTPDTPEIPFDPDKKRAGSFGYQIEFSSDEMRRLGARGSRGEESLGRWIKRTVLEAADREAAAQAEQGVEAAD